MCTSNYICRNCDGKHHISVCGKEKDKKKENGTLITHVSASCGILLQTAKAEIFSIDDSPSVISRFLIDTGSQRTYVTEALTFIINLF